VLSLYNTTFLLYLHYVTTNKRISLNKILGQMTNRNLLKEAIADAKAVKETAIANAKAALEEAFTPHLKSMLAAKLEEMDKDEEVEEAMKAKKEKDMMEEFEVNEMKDEMDEEFDLNEILAELEEGEDKEEMKEAEEEMEAGEEGEMEAGEMGDEEIDLEDMTEDDLKSFIEDVIADMVAAGELEAGEEMEAEMGDMEAEEEMGDMEELDEMDEVSWNEKNNPARGATMKNLAPTKVGQSTSAYAVNEVEESLADPQLLDVAAGVAGLIGGGAGLAYVIDALKSGKAGKAGAALANALEKAAGSAGTNKPTGTKMMEKKEEVEEVTGASGGYDPSSAAGAGLENIINSVKALIKKGGPAAKKAYDVLQQLGAGAAAGMREGEEEMDEMEELKKELQEVNLLNAKLLYTNKIFKSKTLNESQKLRVLKAFDKATSVKEAKVIFETLNEGMTSKTVKTSMMNEIKGSASKATGFISESKQPIVEVDPMVARWQKLAGIK
jgi:hypothetical protein